MVQWRYCNSEKRMVFADNPDGGRMFRSADGLDPEMILEPLPDPAPVISVTPWQIRKALNATGLREAVETAVAAADQNTKDAWAYASSFERSHPLVTTLGAALGKTDAEMDALFTLAASL